MILPPFLMKITIFEASTAVLGLLAASAGHKQLPKQPEPRRRPTWGDSPGHGWRSSEPISPSFGKIFTGFMP